MELPRNITKIGEWTDTFRVYVEDYVTSYMKQLNTTVESKDTYVALYGNCKKEEDKTYIFIYGCAPLTLMQRSTPHLSQAQHLEMERNREEFFPEYIFVGYAKLDGDMIEGFYIFQNDTCTYVSGYAQFYEKNDTMLSYMLHAQKNHSPSEVINMDKYNEVKKRREERKEQLKESRKGYQSKQQEECQKDHGDSESPEYLGQTRQQKLEAYYGKNTNRQEEIGKTVITQKKPHKGLVLCAGIAIVALCLKYNGQMNVQALKETGTMWLERVRKNMNVEKIIAKGKTMVETVANSTPNMEMNQELQEVIQEENSEKIEKPENDKGILDIIDESLKTQQESKKQATNSQEGISQESVTQENASQEIFSQENSSQENSSQENSSQEGVSQESVTQENASQENFSQENLSEGNQGKILNIENGEQKNNKEGTEQNEDTEKDNGLETQEEYYVIKKGDTLIAISIRTYGDKKYVKNICEANNIENPNDIQIGQKILLPQL